MQNMNMKRQVGLRMSMVVALAIAVAVGLPGGNLTSSADQKGAQAGTQLASQAQAGRWETLSNVPVAAWSAALLPTGKVLLFQNGAQRCYLLSIRDDEKVPSGVPRH